MFLQNTEYSSIELYLEELERYISNGSILGIKCQTSSKEKGNLIYFRIFDFKSHIKLLSLFLRDICYYGQLDFCYDKSTNDVYINSLPYILVNNQKVFIFTHDLAEIVKRQVEHFAPIQNIRIRFASPIAAIAMDEKAIEIIPSLKDTKNYILLTKILETIKREKAYIEKNAIKYQEHQRREDLKREYALMKRRKVYGLNPESFQDPEEFRKELNRKIIEVNAKRLENAKRHLKATIKKYASLYDAVVQKAKDKYYSSWYEEIERLARCQDMSIKDYIESLIKNDIDFEDQNSAIMIAGEMRYMRTELRNMDKKQNEECQDSEYYSQEACKFLVDEISESQGDEHLIFNRKFGLDYALIERAAELLLQISAIHDKIEHYESILANPNTAILNFYKNSTLWGSIIEYPYWIKLERDTYDGEKLALLMIKPGTKNVNLDELPFFNNDRDKKRRLTGLIERDAIFDEIENQRRRERERFVPYNDISRFTCGRIIVTIPKSLNYDEIKKIVTFALEHSNKVQFICENQDVKAFVRSLSLDIYDRKIKEQLRWCPIESFYRSIETLGEYYSDTIYTCIDPNFYHNYFLDSPSNKNYWHRFDYTSDYPLHRKEAFDLTGRYITARLAIDMVGIEYSMDLIKELVIGGYNSSPRYPLLQNIYELLMSYNEWKIKQAYKNLEGVDLRAPKRTKETPQNYSIFISSLWDIYAGLERYIQYCVKTSVTPVSNIEEYFMMKDRLPDITGVFDNTPAFSEEIDEPDLQLLF